jgi:spermidine synthase
VDTEGTRSLYENGLVVATVPDPAAAEEAVHFALLEHPAPRRLLLVGGGIHGGLRQALQHPSLEHVDYVELDPAILDVAEKHFAGEWAAARADPRVQVHNLDGRLFLKTTATTFDVIIVNLPDPQTAQLNRFYTLEFFREAARKLAPQGIVSFHVTASENYISPDLADFLRCLNRTLHEVFPKVAVMPGATVHFFATNAPAVLASGPDVLTERLRARKLQTAYVREYFLPFRMSPDRMLDLETQISPVPETPVNRDFAPIAYYFDVALWSGRFDRATAAGFKALAGIEFWKLLVGVSVSFLLLAAGLRIVAPGFPMASKQVTLATFPSGWDTTTARILAGFCVVAMGFTLIGLEILLLLGFQAIYGYVYYQLAMVIAAFMVGMALGARWATHRQEDVSLTRSERDLAGALLPVVRAVVLLQISAALAPILLYALLASFARVETDLGLYLISRFAFPAIALMTGMMGGYQFPLASRIYFAGEATRSPGALYGLDLLGACVGAVVLSVYLFPVYGFLRSAMLMAAVNFAPAVLAALPALAKDVRPD